MYAFTLDWNLQRQSQHVRGTDLGHRVLRIEITLIRFLLVFPGCPRTQTGPQRVQYHNRPHEFIYFTFICIFAN